MAENIPNDSERRGAAEEGDRKGPTQEGDGPHQFAAQALSRADHQAADTAARWTDRRASTSRAGCPELRRRRARCRARPRAARCRPGCDALGAALRRARRPRPLPLGPRSSTLDTVLAIAAAVIGVLAVCTTLNNMFQWIW